MSGDDFTFILTSWFLGPIPESSSNFAEPTVPAHRMTSFFAFTIFSSPPLLYRTPVARRPSNITYKQGVMCQCSRCIPREHPGSSGETKVPNRSQNSKTDPGTDLKHQEATNVSLGIGPAIRILQLNTVI